MTNCVINLWKPRTLNFEIANYKIYNVSQK
jgi:hypothetical protein